MYSNLTKLFVSCALFLCCPVLLAQETVKVETPKGITQITLQRTWCYGSCPVDRLVLNSDGTAIYEGDAQKVKLLFPPKDAPPVAPAPPHEMTVTRKIGLYNASFWTGTFKMVAETLVQNGFFELKVDDNQSNIDSPDVIINVTRDDLDHTVVRHGTSSAFWMLEKVLVGVAADLTWKKDDAASENGVTGSTWREFNSAEKERFAKSKIEKTPVAYTQVTITPKGDFTRKYKTFADSRGRFQLLLPPGEYNISARGNYKPLEWPLNMPLPNEFVWQAEPQKIKVEDRRFININLRAKGEKAAPENH